jgi:hypothetical protein
MDQSDIAAAVAPPTQETADAGDPRQHFAWALGAFPGPNLQMGDVPLHPMVRPELSQRLWDCGFRHHPELQTKWFIPGRHPEAGYLNAPIVVDRQEYDEYLAAHADPEADAEKWRTAAETMLAQVDPKLAARIATMTPEEKAAALQTQREQLPAAFDRLAQLRAEVEKASTDLPPEGD